jgi:nitroreductase
MKLKEAIESRHSVRKFSPKKPDWRDILECIDAARYAPMSGDNFTLKFLIISDPQTIQKLTDASQQDFFANTKYVIVVCSDPKRTINLFKERGKIYSRQQAGAAIQNVLLALTEKKLATCWIGHFVDKLIKRELKIPDNVDIEAMLPIGFEFGKSRKKAKTHLENILYFKTWGNKRMKVDKTPNI